MEVAMQLCPYCHSSHVLALKIVEPENQLSSTSIPSFSPMTLAALGTQVSKRIHVHPLLGGFVGLVIGGVVFLYAQYKSTRAIHYYLCEQCQQHFEVEQ